MCAENLTALRQSLAIVTAKLLRKRRFGSASVLLGGDTLVQTGLWLAVAMFARTLPMTARRSIRRFRSFHMGLRPE